jgi:Icc-related predicted phosphoesterase
MKILTLSDIVVESVYSTALAERARGVGMVLGCGDLPYYYLEFVVSLLNIPVFFVRGNHNRLMEYEGVGPRSEPHGANDLHIRAAKQGKVLLAGVEGSLRYRPGPFQYSQQEMWVCALRLAPKLLRNRLLYGKYLDILVTHAPPRGIHDDDDLPHRGIDAFRWLIRLFRPRYHFHGHIHLYRSDTVRETQFGPTRVINAFGSGFYDVDV